MLFNTIAFSLWATVWTVISDDLSRECHTSRLKSRQWPQCWPNCRPRRVFRLNYFCVERWYATKRQSDWESSSSVVTEQKFHELSNYTIWRSMSLWFRSGPSFSVRTKTRHNVRGLQCQRCFKTRNWAQLLICWLQLSERRPALRWSALRDDTQDSS